MRAFAFFGILFIGCLAHLLSFASINGNGRELYNLQEYSVPGLVFFSLYYIIIMCLAFIAAYRTK